MTLGCSPEVLPWGAGGGRAGRKEWVERVREPSVGAEGAVITVRDDWQKCTNRAESSRVKVIWERASLGDRKGEPRGSKASEL